jgi:hypothetical protein
MTTFHLTGRAVGKTHYLVDKVYSEPDRQIVVAWERERARLLDLLVERCMQGGPPAWWSVPEHWSSDLATLPHVKQREMYHLLWKQKGAVQTVASFRRGGPRHVLIDEIGQVLSVLFGDVEAVTGTEDVKRFVPTRDGRNIGSSPPPSTAEC